MKQIRFPNNWLIKFSIGYLLLPFIIFCLTFLRIWIGLPIVVLLGWITLRIWIQKDTSGEGLRISKRDLIIGLIVLGFWVFLSGIGGFAFQNHDFYIRNAMFKDLINYKWPIYYPEPGNSLISSSSAMIYYIGYWLPAALIGKLFGWQVANIALFLWTLLGVFLTVVLIKERIKSTLLASSLLLIFFSGMDILGTLSIRSISPNVYPTAWPPITAIEWWVGGAFQFSSFTTQLFWVFNQSIPAWICIALILNTKNTPIVFYLWALCFFSAPMPAVGMLPFTLLLIPHKAFDPENISFKWRSKKVKGFFMDCLADIKYAITPENLFGGSIVLLVSALYFSANTNGSKISFINIDAIVFLFYIIFLIYEVMLLWFLFRHEQRNNLWWYAVGGVFVVVPLIRIGPFIDFCMRASIPAIFVLMVWSGEALFRKPNVRFLGALILLLSIGAITPIYEINRSIYRTGEYYFEALTHTKNITYSQSTEQERDYSDFFHPSTLIADMYPSLLSIPPENLRLIIVKTNSSFFFKYLAPPPEY